MDAVVGHRHRLGEPLGLVVHPADPDRVDVPPVPLGLRVFERVAVHLAGAGEQERRPVGLGQPEGVVRPERPDLERLYRVFEVIDRAGRAGEVEDVVDRVADLQRGRDVVPDVPEPGVGPERVEVFEAPGDEVVDGDDLVPGGQEPLAQVGADEPGPAGDECPHGVPSRGRWCPPGSISRRPGRVPAAVSFPDAARSPDPRIVTGRVSVTLVGRHLYQAARDRSRKASHGPASLRYNARTWQTA